MDGVTFGASRSLGNGVEQRLMEKIVLFSRIKVGIMGKTS